VRAAWSLLSKDSSISREAIFLEFGGGVPEILLSAEHAAGSRIVEE